MKKCLKVMKMLVIVAVAVTVFGYVTMRLWNWLMPTIFGWKMITFAQAIGLLLLSKILFGGFHKHGPKPGGGFRERREWKRRMKNRWVGMTPEERERFRMAMKDKWGSGCGPDWMRGRAPWEQDVSPEQKEPRG
ncbi:MAG: hypothetical protein PW792_08955 [Acidobacteriaceae bacterium]|nr:hypothetical protein [Acidobacteriaceae bacterium]